ncbi:hypothetical protein MB84_16050 [Pandoraea oxalativorans]|uniref:Uncharacterized protein n=1 Tax=Pandoraea oxalativorans TaxID=573737 RepID=A0A0E3YER1_9BURK|nr:hypothetical protein MB84_16050 [Pandoraea oxalativorans]
METWLHHVDAQILPFQLNAGQDLFQLEILRRVTFVRRFRMTCLTAKPAIHAGFRHVVHDETAKERKFAEK